MSATSRPLRRYEGLGRQLTTGVGLGVLAWWVTDPSGAWLNVPGPAWMAAALLVPIAHQAIVAFGWRTELFDRALTRRFGERALAVFGAVFLPLLALRLLATLGLAIADAGSLWRPGLPSTVVAVALAAPALWTFVSVARHFGIDRALGADHFVPGFNRPLVRRGVFAVVPNAMYTTGFLALWAVAVAAGSDAALVVAAYQHVFVWCHYLWIERPDMQVIYEDRPTRPERRR